MAHDKKSGRGDLQTSLLVEVTALYAFCNNNADRYLYPSVRCGT